MCSSVSYKKKNNYCDIFGDLLEIMHLYYFHCSTTLALELILGYVPKPND